MHDRIYVEDLDKEGVWDTSMLNVLFCQRDKEIIKSIPLCSPGVQDRIIWHYTYTGRFTVASAYKLGVQLQDDEKQVGIPLALSQNG